MPHERTFSEHKADRLKLYREVAGTPEPIFVLCSDPSGEFGAILSAVEAEVAFEDFIGHRNELAVVRSGETIEAIRRIVEPQQLLIADGHHRFETGQNYRDERRTADPNAHGPQPYDFILVYFAAIEDPGLVILPTHRAVKEVSDCRLSVLLDHAKEFFEIEETEAAVTPETLREAILQTHNQGKEREVFGLATRDRILFLRLRDREKLKTLLPPEIAAPLRDLPVVWLHRVLLEEFLDVVQEEGAPDRVAYVRTGEEVHDLLFKKGYNAAFLLRGTRPEEVRSVAQSGERMPQKSTDFYPKILSGLAVYLHD